MYVISHKKKLKISNVQYYRNYDFDLDRFKIFLRLRLKNYESGIFFYLPHSCKEYFILYK